MNARAAENLAILAERCSHLRDTVEALEHALSHLPEGKRRKGLKYMAKTAAKLADTRISLREFEDYWRQARDFGEDLGADAVAFPADLRAAEQRFQRRRRAEEDAADAKKRAGWDAAIAERLPKLEKRFSYTFGGLTLRPAKDGDEVRREGKVLHHCVGGYVGKYARGETVICVLRRAVEPDAPWRTVELSPKGKLIQDRGYHNDMPGFGVPLDEQYKAALEVFWSAWRERRTSA